MKKFWLCLGFVFAGCVIASAEEAYLDARALPENDGWVLEGEFMRSTKGGTRLAGKFTVANAGVMYLNAYVMTHGGNSRKVTLLVNGKECGAFGDETLSGGQKPGFYWVKGKKPVIVHAGENTIELKGLPYARISYIILSNNKDFIPPTPDE